MTSFFARFSFPLLAKELVELSARRRTYLVRVVYAITLYSVTLWTYWHWLKQFDADSFEMLGRGQTLFNEQLRWQFWGLYLFLPVVTASAITSEKERDTLPLLLMTKLGSWTILFEKLLSRLIAMGSFLLLGLPLAAVAYSLGGVDVELILKATYVLSVTSLQVASFALLCSTWFRTTSSAFVGTYLLGTVGVLFGSELLKLVLGLGISLGAHKLPCPGLTTEARRWFVESVTNNPSYRPLYGPWLLQSDPVGSEHVARMLGLIPEGTNNDFASGSRLPFRIGLNSARASNILNLSSSVMRRTGLPPIYSQRNLWLGPPPTVVISERIDRTTLNECIACSLPLLGSALAFLILARVFLWRRMRVPETSLLARLFGVGDRCFQALNRNPITRGVVFGSVRDGLPVKRPIAWRETRKRSLGTARHLIRLLLLLEVPLLGWIGWRLSTWHGAGSLKLASGMLMPLWILTVLIVTVQSTGLISGEKAKQTLDVLLTTPLPSRDIALQKLAGLRRLMLVLAVPLLTIFIAETTWHTYGLRVVTTPEYRELADDYVDPVSSHVAEGAQHFPANSSMSVQSADTVVFLESAIALFGQILGVLIYLPLLGWIGFQFGMRLRTQTQAIWATLAAVGLICVGPSLSIRGIDSVREWISPPQVEDAFESKTAASQMGNADDLDVIDLVEVSPYSFEIVGIRSAWRIGLAWLSPLRVLFPKSFPNDYGQLPFVVWFLLLFHFAIALGTLCLLRRNALLRFGRWVHRTEAVAGRSKGDSFIEASSF